MSLPNLLQSELPYPLSLDDKVRIVLDHAATSDNPKVQGSLFRLVETAVAADAMNDMLGYRCRQVLRQKESFAQGRDPFMAFALVGRTLASLDPEAMAALENFVDVALTRAL